ncbi:MAG: hypothetical protein WKF40_00405 [Thermoleophilaceae bacterium]
MAAVAMLCVAVPAQASAQPRIKHAECIAACTSGQPRGGSLLLVSGSDLGDVYAAIFPGGRDGIRDLRGRAGQASTSSVRVRVPWEATSGRFVLGTRGGLVSQGRPIQIAPVPVVSRWRCVSQCAPGRKVRGGSLLAVKGVRLQSIRSAVLQGGRGRADDLRARVGSQRFGSFRLRVPAKAVTGNFVGREQRRRSPSRRLVIEAPAAAPAPVPAPGSGVLPGARPAHLRWRGRALRRQPARPHPPGPGRDGGLRHATGRRRGRDGPGRAVPVRGRQLRGDRRRQPRPGLRLHAPAVAHAAQGRASPWPPGRRSAPWETPGAPRAVTSTSSCGARRAGMWADGRSIRCPSSRPGTPRARRPTPGPSARCGRRPA